MKHAITHAVPLRRGLVIAGLVLLVLFFLPAILLLGVQVLGTTQWGRARLAAGLARGVSSAIPGALEVGALAGVDWFELDASDLRFTAPDGTTVLVVDRARVRLDARALLRGELGLSEATTRGGRLVVEERPDGSVPLEDAFSSGRGPPSSVHVWLHGIRVNDLAVELLFDGSEPMRVSGLDALLRIDRLPGQGVEVRWNRARGTLDAGLPIGTLTLKGLQGRVRGGAEHVLEIDGPAHLLDSDLRLHVNYYNRPDPKDRVVIHIDVDAGAARFVSLGADLALEALSDVVDIRMGTPEDEGASGAPESG